MTRHAQDADVQHLRGDDKRFQVRLLSSNQWLVKLTGKTVAAGTFAVGMFLAHVDLERLLVFVMPVALRTLESFAGISGRDLDAAVEARGV
jgi:hypothetical protein